MSKRQVVNYYTTYTTNYTNTSIIFRHKFRHKCKKVSIVPVYLRYNFDVNFCSNSTTLVLLSAQLGMNVEIFGNAYIVKVVFQESFLLLTFRKKNYFIHNKHLTNKDWLAQ